MRFVGSFLILSILPGILARSGGAPEAACESLAPSHQVATQTTPPPYTITLSSHRIEGGESVDVTVEAVSTPFRGLIFQARPNPEDPNIVVGTFSVTQTEIKAVKCKNDDDTLTHASSVDKTSVTFKWTSPIDFNGVVTFT